MNSETTTKESPPITLTNSENLWGKWKTILIWRLGECRYRQKQYWQERYKASFLSPDICLPPCFSKVIVTFGHSIFHLFSPFPTFVDSNLPSLVDIFPSRDKCESLMDVITPGVETSRSVCRKSPLMWIPPFNIRSLKCPRSEAQLF